MASSFLILFREALEAALVIGIVLGFLSKTGQEKGKKFVWFGTLSALVVSVIAAWLFQVFAGGFTGQGEVLFEGITMLAGGALLGTLIIWMMNQSKSSKDITGRMAEKTSAVLHWEIFLVVFFSVVREGVETVLFLQAAVGGTGETDLLGAGLGLLAAGVLGWALFRGALKINLGTFFTVTNVLLLLFAAGLIGRGIGELNEAGVVPSVVDQIWNLNPSLGPDGSLGLWDEKGAVGRFFRSLFGYDGNPSLTQALAYYGSLLFGFIFFAVKKSHRKNS